MGAAVTGPAFKFRRAEHGGKTVEVLDAQLLQGPASQHQLIGKVGRHSLSVSKSCASNISRAKVSSMRCTLLCGSARVWEPLT